VAQLIDAAPTPFYRTILITLDGTRVRRTELTRLKVSDIDSRRLVVHIQDGKGGQDRDVVHCPVLLEEPPLTGAVCATNPSGYFRQTLLVD
jgi:integrase/recombinase XerD